eukprot:Hpha_TRINITY_DN16184_c0_g3::TRINITY_DN16184_c0_g3_i1::g.7891::m.7891
MKIERERVTTGVTRGKKNSSARDDGQTGSHQQPRVSHRAKWVKAPSIPALFRSRSGGLGRAGLRRCLGQYIAELLDGNLPSIDEHSVQPLVARGVLEAHVYFPVPGGVYPHCVHPPVVRRVLRLYTHHTLPRGLRVAVVVVHERVGIVALHRRESVVHVPVVRFISGDLFDHIVEACVFGEIPVPLRDLRGFQVTPCPVQLRPVGAHPLQHVCVGGHRGLLQVPDESVQDRGMHYVAGQQGGGHDILRGAYRHSGQDARLEHLHENKQVHALVLRLLNQCVDPTVVALHTLQAPEETAHTRDHSGHPGNTLQDKNTVRHCTRGRVLTSVTGDQIEGVVANAHSCVDYPVQQRLRRVVELRCCLITKARFQLLSVPHVVLRRVLPFLLFYPEGMGGRRPPEVGQRPVSLTLRVLLLDRRRDGGTPGSSPIHTTQDRTRDLGAPEHCGTAAHYPHHRSGSVLQVFLLQHTQESNKVQK